MSPLFRPWPWILLAVVAFSKWAPAAEISWSQAQGSREWSFPPDHGAHPGYRTEWWYATGILRDGTGGVYGYQLTLFRSALRPEKGVAGNPWSVRDVYAGHFALTGVTARRFSYAERLSREGPGLAGSSRSGLEVRVLDWSMETEGSAFRLKARDRGMELDLTLAVAGGPVLHGEDGLSRKGPAAGQASWYYSFPSMESRGTIRLPWMENTVDVKGTSWFDHEFGSNQLSPDQEGWDWFSLRLDDGSALMIYRLRRRDGRVEPASSGTYVSAEGTWRHLKGDTIFLEVKGRWKSGRSGALYPARWVIEIPDEGLRLDITPLLPDQELRTTASTGITYWEGAVSGRGLSAGRPVTAEGYVEMTGYAESLGGLF